MPTEIQHDKDYFHKRLEELRLERESFMPWWRELSEFIKPRRGRFMVTDRNRGGKRYHNIINSKGTQAHKICTSGMLAGTMSPTRPWFSLETHDPDLMERAAVKEWLYRVELILRTIFNESNFYGQASTLLGELTLFATGAMHHVDDFDNVARFYTHTAGSYMIGQDDKFNINTMAREYEWTVGQIVRKFSLEKVSRHVRDQWDRGNYEKWYPLVHFVEPNDEYNPYKKVAKNKAFKSIYYEPGGQGPDRDKWLNVSGFDDFPFYVPRWDVTGEDIYGTDCPGMIALGDIKGLQMQERRKAQAIDKMVNPPLKGPPQLKQVPINTLPAGATIYDGDDSRQKLEPIYTVTPQLQDLRFDMDAVERRIEQAFFVDMFLAITNIEGIQPRNQLDLLQRNEERLLQLGPVLEHIQVDFLDPLIDRAFNQAQKAGILPPPPDEIVNTDLRIKYISTLAMAQRAVATQGIDRVAAFAISLTQGGFTGAAIKFNDEQAVDEYARAIGIPPSIIRPDEEVEQIKAEQAKAIQAQQQAEMANQMGQAVKNTAQADTSGKNALTDLLGG